MYNYIVKLIEVIKKMHFILDSKYRFKVIFVFISIVISSILEMLGISIIIPFVAAMVSPNVVRTNQLITAFFNYFNISVNDFQLVIILATVVVVVYLIKNIVLIITDYISLKFENLIFRDYSVIILSSFMKRSYEDSLDTNSSEVIKGINNDVTAIYYVFQSFFKLFSSMLTILLICSFLIRTDFIMSIFIFFISGFLSLLLFVIIKKPVKKAGIIFNETGAITTKSALQSINGFKELTVLKRVDKFIDLYKTAQNDYIKAQLNFRFIQLLPHRIIECIFILCIIFVILFRLSFGMDIVAFFPELSAFAVAAIRILPLINSVSDSNSTILYYLPSFNIAYNNIIVYKKQNNLNNVNTNLTNISFNNFIELKNVSWKYKKSDEPIFKNLNLKIKKGTTNGIIGYSGSGKTTLIDIILGLLRPQTGDVFSDDVSIFSNVNEWSKHIGYVPQNVFLLDDTIRNNILFGLEPDKNTDLKIWHALEKAQIKEFVEQSKEGLNMFVGERGSKISGGQMQRIAIARALYYNPDILILDEATSALDKETEKAVIDTIYKLKNEKTLIIISHNTTILNNCDKLYEINNGIKVLR